MIERVRTLYRRLTAPPGDSDLPLPAAVRSAGRWIVVFYRELQRDRAFERAGALAYGTLVSFVPLLLLLFGVLQYLGVADRNEQVIDILVFDTFLGDLPQVRDVLLPGLRHINFGAVGAIGTIGWLWVGFRIYMMMEQAYTDFFRARINRTVGRRLRNFYLTLTGVPVTVGVVWLGTSQIAEHLGATWWTGFLTIVVPMALLAWAIKTLPCTTVHWAPALVGGVVSGVLVEAGSVGFAQYVRTFASHDPIIVIYGSIGFIPVFLLWLYLFWIFTLLGVEIAHVAQNYRSLVRAEREQRRQQSERLRMPNVEDAIEVASVVAWSFLHGRGPMPETAVSERCRLPEYRLPLILEVLEASRVLTKVAEGLWTVERPPADVHLREIADAWRDATALRPDDAVSRAVDTALADVFASTLAEAAERWVEPTTETRTQDVRLH